MNTIVTSWAPTPELIEAHFEHHATSRDTQALYPWIGLPLADLKARFRDRTVSAQWKDDILRGLVEAAQRRDELAHLTVLMLLIPAAIRQASTVASLAALPSTERVTIVLSRFWEQILRHPLHRTGSVAKNITMDALKSLTDKDITDQAMHLEQLPSIEAQEALLATAGHQDTTNPTHQAELDVAAMFAWAIDAAVLTSQETQLLSLWYLGDDSDKATAVQLLGHAGSPDSARRHIARIRTKLAHAVRSEISANGWT